MSATLGTLALAALAAWACQHLQLPIPWMLGPLLVTALASLRGLPTRSDARLRNIGQWVMGTSLGLYFTPAVAALVLGLWWAVLAAVAWALVLGTAYGTWLYRSCSGTLPGVDEATLKPTAYFAGAIGAASEMTLLAEREGARTDLVAASHSLRMLIVVLVVPLGMWSASAWWGGAQWPADVPAEVHPVHRAPMPVRGAAPAWTALALLALCTGAGAAVLRTTPVPNPWFLGPLTVAVLLAVSTHAPASVPGGLSSSAQLLIGVSLGVRFRPAFARTAPRWLARVTLGTLAMLAACAVFGMLLAGITGLHPATAILATAPGGMTEMSITAKVLQLGAPVVTALHVTRLVAVLVLIRPLYAWQSTRGAAPQP